MDILYVRIVRLWAFDFYCKGSMQSRDNYWLLNENTKIHFHRRIIYAYIHFHRTGKCDWQFPSHRNFIQFSTYTEIVCILNYIRRNVQYVCRNVKKKIHYIRDGSAVIIYVMCCITWPWLNCRDQIWKTMWREKYQWRVNDATPYRNHLSNINLHWIFEGFKNV